LGERTDEALRDHLGLGEDERSQLRRRHRLTNGSERVPRIT
jgi:hypothetical protein